MSEIGHNSDPTKRRKEFVQRFVQLFEDVQEMQAEIRDLTAEAKDAGMNPKVIKLAAKDKMNPERKKARDALMDELDQLQAAIGAL